MIAGTMVTAPLCYGGWALCLQPKEQAMIESYCRPAGRCTGWLQCNYAYTALQVPFLWVMTDEATPSPRPVDCCCLLPFTNWSQTLPLSRCPPSRADRCFICMLTSNDDVCLLLLLLLLPSIRRSGLSLGKKYTVDTNGHDFTAILPAENLRPI